VKRSPANPVRFSPTTGATAYEVGRRWVGSNPMPTLVGWRSSATVSTSLGHGHEWTRSKYYFLDPQELSNIQPGTVGIEQYTGATVNLEAGFQELRMGLGTRDMLLAVVDIFPVTAAGE